MTLSQKLSCTQETQSMSETDTIAIYRILFLKCHRLCPCKTGLVSPSRTRYPYLVVAGDAKDVSRVDDVDVVLPRGVALDPATAAAGPSRVGGGQLRVAIARPEQKAEKIGKKSKGRI